MKTPEAWSGGLHEEVRKGCFCFTLYMCAVLGQSTDPAEGVAEHPQGDNTQHSASKTRALKIAQEGHLVSSMQSGGSFGRKQPSNADVVRCSRE